MFISERNSNPRKESLIFIQETPKRVLLQTVKTQMKHSKMQTLKTQHNAAFHQGLHCLYR